MAADHPMEAHKSIRGRLLLWVSRLMRSEGVQSFLGSVPPQFKLSPEARMPWIPIPVGWSGLQVIPVRSAHTPFALAALSAGLCECYSCTLSIDLPGSYLP